MKGRWILLAGLLSVLAAVAGVPVCAAELLAGQVEMEDGSVREFSLSGESREQILGGELRFGERAFRVTGVSRLGLIGARRSLGADSRTDEFAVLSSSFSTQTAQGQPWVTAQRYFNCERRYNSFLAIYRVDDPVEVQALGERPYPTLVEESEKSDHSEVFCFTSRPPS